LPHDHLKPGEDIQTFVSHIKKVVDKLVEDNVVVNYRAIAEAELSKKIGELQTLHSKFEGKKYLLPTKDTSSPDHLLIQHVLSDYENIMKSISDLLNQSHHLFSTLPQKFLNISEVAEMKSKIGKLNTEIEKYKTYFAWQYDVRKQRLISFSDQWHSFCGELMSIEKAAIFFDLDYVFMLLKTHNADDITYFFESVPSEGVHWWIFSKGSIQELEQDLSPEERNVLETVLKIFVDKGQDHHINLHYPFFEKGVLFCHGTESKALTIKKFIASLVHSHSPLTPSYLIYIADTFSKADDLEVALGEYSDINFPISSYWFEE
jgi:hypothetical protein